MVHSKIFINKKNMIKDKDEIYCISDLVIMKDAVGYYLGNVAVFFNEDKTFNYMSPYSRHSAYAELEMVKGWYKDDFILKIGYSEFIND